MRIWICGLLVATTGGATLGFFIRDLGLDPIPNQVATIVLSLMWGVICGKAVRILEQRRAQ